MSNHADFVLRADPENARAIGDRVLSDAGFTVAWQDHATGHAQRGSLALTLLLGAFVGKKRQLMKVDLAIFTGNEPGTMVVRLTRASSGWMAGIIGARRARAIFTGLVQDLAARFGQAGALVGVHEA